jgi:uncharacterized iron-regulated membrane protein
MFKELGVALLFGFIAGGIFLLGQLMYAQLVLMPRLVARGDSLAVSVDIWWAVRAAAVACIGYLAWMMWPGRKPRR